MILIKSGGITIFSVNKNFPDMQILKKYQKSSTIIPQPDVLKFTDEVVKGGDDDG